MLAGRDLVMDVLDGDAHRLEVLHGALAVVGRDVERRLVEVPALIEELGSSSALEVEELELRADVERVAEVGRASELPLQHAARIAVERRAVGVEDVAEHPRDRMLGLPRDQLERRGVGHRDHVGLLDPAEALDRGAVEAHPLGERSLELLGRDREGLQEAQHVGEPQADEPDTSLLDRAQHVLGFGGQHGTRVGAAPGGSVTAV